MLQKIFLYTFSLVSETIKKCESNTEKQPLDEFLLFDLKAWIKNDLISIIYSQTNNVTI